MAISDRCTKCINSFTQPKKFKKVGADVRICQGVMAKARIRHMTWPRIILIYFGHKDVKSAPNGRKLHASEVPRLVESTDLSACTDCNQMRATHVAKPKEMPTKKQPALAAEL